MAVRYRNSFYSIAGIQWQIDILDSTFSGSVTLFKTGSEGFSLTYKGITERLDPILSSALTLPCEVENTVFESFLIEIMTAQEERFTVKVYKNLVLYWVGVVLADLVQIEDTAFPYSFDLTFTDGLARLKDIDYNSVTVTFPYVNRTPYTGRDTIIAHLLKILAKTGIAALYNSADEFLRTAVNWYDVRHQYTSYTDPLSTTNLNHAIFYEYDDAGNIIYKKAAEVLEMILRSFNARILMVNGLFHVIQAQEYARPTTYMRLYSNTGTTKGSYSNFNFRLTPTVDTRKTGGIFKYFGPLNRVVKTYKPKISPINSGSILPIQLNYNPAVSFLNTFPGEIVMFFSGAIHQWFTAGTFSTGQFWSKWKMTVIATDISDGTKWYLTNKYSSNGTTDRITWSGSASDSIIISTPVYNGGASWNELYPIQFSIPPLPGVEFSGTFKFELINNYNPGGTTVHTFNSYLGDIWGWECNGYELVPDLTEGAASIDDIKFTAQSWNAGQSLTASTIELSLPDTLIGDGPAVTHLGKLQTYNGASWEDSSAWGVHNSTPRININQLSVNENLKGQRIPTEKFMGVFINNSITAMNSLIWGARVFVPLMITINPATDEVNGEWFNVIIPPM